MACYTPYRHYRVIGEKTDEGKKLYVSSHSATKGRPFIIEQTECGQCTGCRIRRIRDMSIRCCHEARLHKENLYLTLTYNDENLPEDRCVRVEEFQSFMKKLRHFFNRWYYDNKSRKYRRVEKSKKNKFKGRKLRYYVCGEYGRICRICGVPEKLCRRMVKSKFSVYHQFKEQLGRPHFHAIVFNCMFYDLEVLKEENGFKYYESEKLNSIWEKGEVVIGEVNSTTAAYVAKYIMKRVTGKQAENHYRQIDPYTGEIRKLTPEFRSSSNRPGIGYDWIVKNFRDVYPKDFVTYDGTIYRTPSYYDKVYEVHHPDRMEEIKNKRKHEIKEGDPEKWFSEIQKMWSKEKQIEFFTERKL